MTREEYYAAVAEYKETHLEHHGILGQKWGIRRYQNPDGTLTEKGKKRAYKEASKQASAELKEQAKFHGRDIFKKQRKGFTVAQKVAGIAGAAGLGYSAYKNIQASKNMLSGDTMSMIGNLKSAQAGANIARLAGRIIINSALIKTGMTIGARHANDKVNMQYLNGNKKVANIISKSNKKYAENKR